MEAVKPVLQADTFTCLVLLGFSHFFMPTLGVVVFSLQGMKHLSRCLDSVQWADAVTVRRLDQETRALASGEAGQPFQEISTDWVLHLWGEERVEAELSEELRLIRQAELQTAPLSYLIPVRSHLLGCWVKGSLWGPTPSPRLCRWVEDLPVGWWSVARKVRRGTSGLVHGWIGDYCCAELRDGVDRINSMSSLWAERLLSEGRSLNTFALTVRPLRILMRLLFINRLFCEGLAGLSLSVLAAYATLAGGMKLWEARQAASRVRCLP
ncbi:MAG: hypothetical protein ACE5JU_00940 [Candidatus Binatia bacterium]